MLKKDKIVKRIEKELDFDFNVDIRNIETMSDFNKELLFPFQNGKKIFYRGERKNSISRPLLPSIYRNKDFLFGDKERITVIDCDFLYNFYQKSVQYFDMYEKIIGKIKTDEMYSFLAFSQHYFGISPFIDFTKSLYVAASFALKDRKEYEEDILLYTLELKDDEDYTTSLDTANKWIKDYSVCVFKDVTKKDFENPAESLAESLNELKRFSKNVLSPNPFDISPKAKLIDVPTNDLMRYQQGVFLLLDDFSLFSKSYLTKKIRDDFIIKKWLINKDICPQLLRELTEARPYYAYKHITDLTSVVSELKANAFK